MFDFPIIILIIFILAIIFSFMFISIINKFYMIGLDMKYWFIN
jgi:hypothetical protein